MCLSQINRVYCAFYVLIVLLFARTLSVFVDFAWYAFANHLGTSVEGLDALVVLN